MRDIHVGDRTIRIVAVGDFGTHYNVLLEDSNGDAWMVAGDVVDDEEAIGGV